MVPVIERTHLALHLALFARPHRNSEFHRLDKRHSARACFITPMDPRDLGTRVLHELISFSSFAALKARSAQRLAQWDQAQ